VLSLCRYTYILVNVYSKVGLTNLVVINATRPVLVCVCVVLYGRTPTKRQCMRRQLVHNEFRGSAAQRFRIITRTRVHDILLLRMWILSVCIYIIRVCCVYNIEVVTPSLSVVKTLRSFVPPDRRLATRWQHIIYHTRL
jgi:hypothetical protein